MLFLAAFMGAVLPPMQRITTANGTSFGVVLYPTPLHRQPSLVIALTGALNDTLGCSETSSGDKCYYSNVCQVLVAPGSSWACVSLDLPSHGNFVEPGEPVGIAGWQWRLAKGQNFVDQSNARIADILAYLKDNPVSPGSGSTVQIDTSDVVITGISRGESHTSQ